MLRSILQFGFRTLANLLPDKQAVQFTYFRYLGHLPNLKNPQTFNEKIAWRKLYQRDPRFTTFTDKVAVKEELKKLIDSKHILPNLWVGENPDDIPFDSLTPPYVIKVNHGCCSNIFVRTKADEYTTEIRKALRIALAHSHGKLLRQWGYYNIPPKILIEPMIKTPSGDPPEDYKFFVYHGKAHFIQLDYDRFKGQKENYYDTQWNRLPVVVSNCPTIDQDVPKPARLDQMIALAEKIGLLFDFARIDLYDVQPEILFGEVTFYPSAGIESFDPEIWATKFGEPWIIKCMS